MEHKKIFTLCLMVGFVSANGFLPTLGAAHEDGEKTSHVHLTCNAESVAGSNVAEIAGTRVIMNCTRHTSAGFQVPKHSVQRAEASSEWEEYPSYDELIF